MSFLSQLFLSNPPPFFFPCNKNCFLEPLPNSISSAASVAAIFNRGFTGNSRHFIREDATTHPAIPLNQQRDKSLEFGNLPIAVQMFDKKPRQISVSTNYAGLDRYASDSELGRGNLIDSAETNATHDVLHHNESTDNCAELSLMGPFVDGPSFIEALNSCYHLGNLDVGRKCHALAIKIGFDRDKFVATSLLGMYAKGGEIESASEIFRHLSDLDIVSCNCLIYGYASNGLLDEALNLFKELLSMGIRLNHYTFSIVLGICGNRPAVEEGKQLHSLIIKMRLVHEPAVGNALLTMYSKCGMVKETQALFEKLPNRNIISWTAIITGFYKNGCFEKSLKHFCDMRSNAVHPNEHTFAVALASSGSSKNSLNSRSLHAVAIKSGTALGVFAGTAIVDMYSELAEMHNAEQQLEEMINVATQAPWNALMIGYVKNGMSKDAMDAFNRMLKNSTACDPFTYSTILKACSSLPSLASGKQIHSRLIKARYDLNAHVGSALTEMYSKCGSLADAEHVFNRMHKRDTVIWNSIIKAHSQNGVAERAISLFRQMVEDGIRPTSATFLAVISACSHSGLIEQGKQIFKAMVQDYGLTPEEKHYSCMVDLLGRVGRLEDAMNFINSLPAAPTAAIWRPLLAACRCHRNLEMAEHVAEKILQLEPGDATVYITLSNMYAELGRWGDVVRQRELMELREVKKEAGCSWIEVDHRMYEFFSGDERHRETPEIHKKLEEIVKQIRGMGYNPNSNLALDHRTGNLREKHVLHHSEKLAVIFGLIRIPDGRPIRVFKNLRTCDDCHSAMKYISSTTERQIVLRDNYRFHCFKQGSCSCGDYW